MPPQRGFVHGAMLLAGAAMVAKLLGSVYTIVLQNVIGDSGMGLFQMAYPIYATLLAIATAGFPVAVSKLVSEQLARGEDAEVRHTLRVAGWMLTGAGVVTFAILFLGADLWAKVAGDARAAWAIRAIAPALLLVPVMSALRGYFQGFQWMYPTAVSQVVEQFVRVATILVMAVWLMRQGYGEAAAAAGAAFGAVTGAFAGLLLLGYYWVTRHPETGADHRLRRAGARPGAARRLLYYALPISLGALVVPLMNNVDVVTVVNLLKQSGEPQATATAEFGLLTGRAFKLMMLPTTLASSIGIAVMPAVSEAFTLGFRRLMEDRVDQAVRLTLLLSLPAAVGLALLARPVDLALFKDTAGSDVIQVMAFATVFASLQTTLAAVLQGAGWVYLPVLHLLAGSACKVAGNLAWVAGSGIRGAALATVLGYAVATLLNLWAVRRYLGVRIDWLNWAVRPGLATFVMGGFVFAMSRQWMMWGGLSQPREWVAVAAAAMVLGGGLIYFLALAACGALSRAELEAVPKVGPRLAAWCSKLGLLRT
ncbi:putative polysaccharide biosynthesis protein [Alicyclobacillus macrosporangiidus]|uniref:Polysaccharide transporter, PST family/stage V sporulation protein B n=1 Tax=Alicyclobacillus macrosporangiidus TaxID=392015 RepID=A0A1I7KQR3_9BACL|nr:polysaccharide biosynthesis protein [Alicyclobacillus macrosporangiidus]SFU99783.1 polysaccharide transporter, PST family/stage V sporulation protein B [Alicyclobacillus macrosporangiidus]